MRITTVALTVAALVITLGACGSADPEPFGVPAAPSSSAPPVEQTPAEIELYGPRVELPGGLLLKQLGKVAQVNPVESDDPQDWVMRIVLDKIEVDPDCGPYRFDSGRSHTLVLSLRVETSARYDQARHGIPQYFEWSTIGPDGVTEAPPTSSSDCRNGKGFPSELRPAAKYRGEVTVDTSNPTGRLVLSDMFAWDYPVA